MMSLKLYTELTKHIGVYKASSDIFIRNNKMLTITRPTGHLADDKALEQLTLIDTASKKVLAVVITTSDTDIKKCVLKIVNKFLR